MILLASALALSIGGHAPLCFLGNSLQSMLEKKYTEVQLPVEFKQDDGVFQFWVNMETQSWTIIYKKNRVSCIVAADKGIEVMEEDDDET